MEAFLLLQYCVREETMEMVIRGVRDVSICYLRTFAYINLQNCNLRWESIPINSGYCSGKGVNNINVSVVRLLL